MDMEKANQLFEKYLDRKLQEWTGSMEEFTAYKKGVSEGAALSAKVLEGIAHDNEGQGTESAKAPDYDSSDIMRLIGEQDINEIMEAQINGRPEARQAIDDIARADAGQEIKWVCLDALTYGYIMGKRAERRKHKNSGNN